MKPEALKKIHDKRTAERKLHRLHNAEVVIRDDLPPDFDINSTIMALSKISSQLFAGVEKIIIGNFGFLQNAGKASVYKNGTIYVTNNKSEEEVYEAVVHELAHVVESYRGREIYVDSKVKKEFIRKRLKLFQVIEAHFPEINMDKNYYVNSGYNTEFDNFLVSDIGYGRLQNIIDGLFVSPYAATSLSEYFARSFEDYFSFSFDKRKTLQKISPEVYNKLDSILA